MSKMSTDKHSFIRVWLWCELLWPQLQVLITWSTYEVFMDVFLLWALQKPGYHFWSNWELLKLDRWKMHFFASLAKRKQCKIQHCFGSQNVRPVFLLAPGWNGREKERGGPVCTPQKILLFRPFFDISIIYAKYLDVTWGQQKKW